MTRKTKLYFISFSLAGCVLVAVSQQFFNPPVETLKEAEERTPPPALLLIDRNTWEVFDPNDRAADLSRYNTPEAKLERYKATLGIEDPEEFQRQFPPTQEQLARKDEISRAILQPVSVQDVLNSKRTPEERQALEDSLNRMVNPAVATEPKP